MKHPTLIEILSASAGKVPERKIADLRRALEKATGANASAFVVDDPVKVRRTLVFQLRSEGASAGTIQAMEQFFMGVIRRAAVNGVLTAPPEGPWTSRWQAVIGLVSDKRVGQSHLRSLAGWSTGRGIEPADITATLILEWCNATAVSERDARTVRLELHSRLQRVENTHVLTTAVLDQRLLRKAEFGSIRGMGSECH